MKPQLILPKTLVEDVNILHPLLFFAGPIQGGGDWHEPAYDYVASQCSNISIAAPRRWGTDHRLGQYREQGIEEAFARQTLWERHYLEIASRTGCVVFWLTCESKVDPRQDGQPYGRDTYGELGAWRTKLAADPSLRVVFGAEKDYPGLSVFQCNLNADVGYEYPIYSSLRETLFAALLYALPKG